MPRLNMFQKPSIVWVCAAPTTSFVHFNDATKLGIIAILRSLRSERLEGWRQHLDSPSFETHAPDSAMRCRGALLRMRSEIYSQPLGSDGCLSWPASPRPPAIRQTATAPHH